VTTAAASDDAAGCMRLEEISRVRAADSIAQLIEAAQASGGGGGGGGSIEMLRSIIFERFDLRHRLSTERQKRIVAENQWEELQRQIECLSNEVAERNRLAQSVAFSLRQGEEVAAGAAAAAALEIQRVFSRALYMLQCDYLDVSQQSHPPPPPPPLLSLRPLDSSKLLCNHPSTKTKTLKNN
jgi:hypothetical protein